MNANATSTTSAPRRRPLTLLTAGLASLLLATACGNGGSSDASSSSAGEASSSASASASSASASPVSTEAAAAGEGSGDTAALEGVSLTVADDGTPTVTVDKAVESDQQSTRVLTPGDGAAVQENSLVKVNVLQADPATGQVQDETFTTGAQTAPVTAALQQSNPDLYDLLIGMKEGGQFAAYLPAQESTASATSSDAPATTTTQPAALYIYQIEQVLPTHAEGAAVTELDDRLPEVTEDAETHEPTIAKPEGEAPDELVAQTLIEGEGAAVQETDTVTVQYTGVKWSDGSTFDSSWEAGQPATFALDQVIEGWTQGLAGQKVGSRVLLSIPSDLAYGSDGSGDIGADEDLLFVVDILDATPAATTSSASPSADASSSTSPSASASSASPSTSASSADQ